MGEVYRAHDTRLDRPVALKILPDTAATDEDARLRLLREARRTSAIDHANIVTIYSFEETDAALLIVMEYVEGRDLRELIESGPLSIDRVLHIGYQVADALAAAHSEGVVHRDIKPSNILVAPDGQAKVVDFGVAAAFFDPGNVDTALGTRASEQSQQADGICGTVGYMSPEQVLAKPLDGRSDLFSLGCVLYEAATGRSAFPGATPYEIMRAIAEEDPPLPSTLGMGLPSEFDFVLAKLLAKEREQRYAEASEPAADLRQLASGSPQSRPTTASGPFRRIDNLPPQPGRLIGREKERDEVAALLREGSTGLVTLTGPPGTGKTRLAVSVAASLRDEFRNGLCFVDLAPIHDPDLVAATISQALGLRETRNRSVLEGLRDSLRDAELLILLDNFEQVIAAAPVVSTLAAVSSTVRILVTSREVLRVREELAYHIGELALPEELELPPEELQAASPAVELFVERAAAVKPDFRLTTENAAAVARICRQLDGLPLAIELAAARVKMLPPSTILERLRDQFTLLTGGARDLPDRQRTLRDAIDWSYELLDDDEKVLLQRLCLFVGGCGLDAAEAVIEPGAELGTTVLDGLSSLVDKSFVVGKETAQAEPRFLLLETIREYGLSRLRDGGSNEETRRRHADYYLQMVETASPKLETAEGKEWLSRLTVEHGNLRAALESLIDCGTTEKALRMGGALWRFWERRGHLQEGRARLDQLLELSDATRYVGPTMKVLYAAGVLADAQGDYTAARGHFSRHLEACRRLDYPAGVGTSLNNLAITAQREQDYETARSLFVESLEILKQLDDQEATAWSLYNLSQVSLYLQDLHAARSFAEEALELNRSVGDERGVAWSLSNRADVARAQDDWQAARSDYEDGLGIFRRLGDDRGIASVLADLAELARLQGREREARDLLRESLESCQALEDRTGIARVFERLAVLLAGEDPGRAIRLASAAARLREELGTPLPPASREGLRTALESARESLGKSAAAHAWEEGERLSTETIVAAFWSSST